MSVPGGPVFIAGTGCPDAVGMMGSVASPVVRHRQQTLDLMTGVRQGLQKVHPPSPAVRIGHRLVGVARDDGVCDGDIDIGRGRFK